jgi:L-fuculose-phosphate aldolase
MNLPSETPPLVVIGHVRSPLTAKRDCPKQYSEGAPPAEVHVLPAFAPALHTLAPGQDIVLLTWLHAADRDTLSVHPRGDASLPRKGVFNTRSPDRPNPLGLHRCTLLAVDGTVLRVNALEVLDQTPVVDIKPVYHECGEHRNWGAGIPAEAGEALRAAGERAWSRGLVSGTEGNASLRLGDAVAITRSGSAKGHLAPGDLTTLDLATGRTIGPGQASIEAGMHLEVYRRQPAARAIFHTHPGHLLALSLRRGPNPFGSPLPEAEFLRARLAAVPALAPGSAELAEAVGAAAATHPAVLLQNHGLLCWADTPQAALDFSEQLDALARVELLAAG